MMQQRKHLGQWIIKNIEDNATEVQKPSLENECKLNEDSKNESDVSRTTADTLTQAKVWSQTKIKGIESTADEDAPTEATTTTKCISMVTPITAVDQTLIHI